MRKITIGPRLVFMSLLGLILGLDIYVVYFLYPLFPFVPFKEAACVLVFMFFFFLFLFLTYRIYMAIFPLKSGLIPGNSSAEFHYHVHLIFYLILFYPLLRCSLVPVPLLRLVYGILGGNWGHNSYVSGVVLDPMMTSIGKNTLLGLDSLVFSHVIEGSHLAFEPVSIGDNVTIGAKAIIMPGVEIKNGAMVAAGAVVIKGTHIGPGEKWGGIPAKKLKSSSVQMTRNN